MNKRFTKKNEMETKHIYVVIRPNQTQFDKFSSFWLSLDFPWFQGTGIGWVTGI